MASIREDGSPVGAVRTLGGGSGFHASMSHNESTYSLHEYRDLDTYDSQSHSQSHSHLSQPPSVPAVRSGSTPVLIGSRFLEIGLLGPYSTFGEVGVLLRCPRTASVVSLTGGGQIVSITKFDFLRLNTRKALNNIRHQALAYPTNEELMYELDDTRQWEVYKRQLSEISKDKTNNVQKLQQMPVVRR